MKTILNETEFLNAGFSIAEYKSKAIEEAKALQLQVSEFYPCEIFYTCSEQDGKLYFEYANVRLTHPTLNLEIGHSSYNKKYSIVCRSFSDLKNTNYNTVEMCKKDLTEPNNIGKLNAKKILAWVNYYEEIYKRLKVVNDKNGSVKDDFLKSIEGLPVKWDREKKSGRIVINGIEFTFSIGETYISQNLAVHYSVSANVQEFLQLSNNQWKVSPDRAHLIL